MWKLLNADVMTNRSFPNLLRQGEFSEENIHDIRILWASLQIDEDQGTPVCLHHEQETQIYLELQSKGKC